MSINNVHRIEVTNAVGALERLDLDKIHRVIMWAAKGLNTAKTDSPRQNLKVAGNRIDYIDYMANAIYLFNGIQLPLFCVLISYSIKRRKIGFVDIVFSERKLYFERPSIRSPPRNTNILEYHMHNSTTVN